jgi:hypothetical protein
MAGLLRAGNSLLKRFFLASFAAGVLLTLLAARFYPVPEPEKVYSLASALANGGREEVYIIRLPDDRLGSPRAASTAPYPQQAFSATGTERVLAELFRVRNREGEIVGLASRMNGKAPDDLGMQEAVTDWMLLIPGRGALMMSRGTVEAGGEREFFVDRMGFSFANSGPIISGTGDFEGLSGFYQEETEIEKVDANGQAFGSVKLSTRMKSAAP